MVALAASPASCAAVTVTVCAVFQFVVVKVSEAGEKVTFVLLLDGVTVTDSVGWVFSFAV